MPAEIAIGAVLLAFLATSLESGFRFGRRVASSRDTPGGGQVGTIQGAMLGLLGLLLGFSFASAGSRFLERQDLIVEEANAIGTAYLRADMLDEPHRSQLRASLADYVNHRLELSDTLRFGLTTVQVTEISVLHDRIWKAASEGVAARPSSIMAVLQPVNQVIDLHSSRVAAGRKHLPLLVMGLLAGCSAMSMAVVGYGCGLTGRRVLVMTASLTILVAATLWTIIDLDHPRAGLLRLNDAPLRELTL